MSDIFSDEILTAPPRSPARVMTAFIAYDEKAEAELGQKMMGAIIKERGASETVIVPKLPVTPKRPILRDLIIDALVDTGECTPAQMARITGRSHSGIADAAIKMFEDGELDRRRNPNSKTRYIYRIASAEARNGPPRHQAEHSAACGAETHGRGSTGENMGVL